MCKWPTAFWLLVQMRYKPRSQGCLVPVLTERERRVGEIPGNEVDALSLSNRRLEKASAIHVHLRLSCVCRNRSVMIQTFSI